MEKSMPNYIVRASYPLDAYKNFEAIAATPEEALQIIKTQVDGDDDLVDDVWDNQEFDFECAGDTSYVVEQASDSKELIYRPGVCHRYAAAAPKMLAALKVALPMVQEEIALVIQGCTIPDDAGEPDLTTIGDTDRAVLEPMWEAERTIKEAIAAAEGEPS
jgi:hypothetical protein